MHSTARIDTENQPHFLRTQMLSRFAACSRLVNTWGGISPSYQGPVIFISVASGSSIQPRMTYLLTEFLLVSLFITLIVKTDPLIATVPVDLSMIFLPFLIAKKSCE